LPAGYADYNDYLIRGITIVNSPLVSGARLLFENGPTTAADSRTQVIGSTTYTVVNLNSQSSSAAATSPIGRAKAALLALTGRPVNNAQTEVAQVASLGRSEYKGLIVNLRSRNRDLLLGFKGSFRVAYTLSWTKDDGIVNTSNGQYGPDFTREFSRSSQDRRHRLAVSGTFDGPIWLGGLRFSPIARVSSGAPFNLGNGGVDRNLDDVSNDRPNYSGTLSAIKARDPNGTYQSYVPLNLSLPPIGAQGGNLPRDAGQGPAQVIFDMNVSRQFKLERFRIRPAVEFNNILNHTSYTYANDFIDFGSVTSADIINPNSAFAQSFLVPQRTLRPRQIRFGLRIDF
jgi:hypothetical protein